MVIFLEGISVEIPEKVPGRNLEGIPKEIPEEYLEKVQCKPQLEFSDEYKE